MPWVLLRKKLVVQILYIILLDVCILMVWLNK